MRILITGANGFIGTELTKSLSSKEDVEVFPVSRSGGYDLSKTGWTENLPAADVVIHLAQSLEYRKFPEGAQDMVAVNITATAELLEWSRRNGIKHFLFSSTGNVYAQKSEPLYESDPCIPYSMYGATKLSAEQLISQYKDLFHCTVLRIFGVYGPGQEGMTIPNILSRIIEGKKLTLAKGLGLVFSPIYITDCIEILIRVSLNTPQNGFSLFNVAGSKIHSLAEVIKEIENITENSADVNVTNGEPMYLIGNSEKVYNEVGYVPQTDIRKGLIQVIKHKELETCQ